MKLNEPRPSEKARWNNQTKGGIILDHKDYLDYLKESEYNKEYKKYWTNFYMEHKLDEQTDLK